MTTTATPRPSTTPPDTTRQGQITPEPASTTVAPPCARSVTRNTRWQSWVEFVTTLLERALSEGDVTDRHEPEDVAKMLVALWLGVRRISDLDQPEHYFDNLRKTWTLALACFTSPDRTDYFTQFITRRHALAVKKVSTEGLGIDLHSAATASAHTE